MTKASIIAALMALTLLSGCGSQSSENETQHRPAPFHLA